MALRSRNKEGTIVKDAKLVVIIDGGWKVSKRYHVTDIIRELNFSE